MMPPKLSRFVFVLVLLPFCAMLPGCGPIVNSLAPGRPGVTIGSPPQGATVNLNQDVLVQAIAVDSNGIARIELWVDGALIAMSQPPATQTTDAAVLHWTPTAAGTHMLMVKAINTGGVTSDPTAITVNVVGPNVPTAAAPTAAAPTAAAPPPTVAAAAAPASPTVAATSPPVTPTLAACQNNADFVEHVTVPDGTNWTAGQAFNKIWRVRNSGSCTWGPDYGLVFVGGEAMTTQSSAVIPYAEAGATSDILVAMTAPATPGTHSGQWRLRSTTSGLFGVTVTVAINVLGAAPLPAGCAGVPVIASFDASPATIAAGQAATLSWGKVDNATSAVIDQGLGGVATPGSVSVHPGQTTTFTLTATGCGGTITKQVAITVSGTAGGTKPGNNGPSESIVGTWIVLPSPTPKLEQIIGILPVHPTPELGKLIQP